MSDEPVRYYVLVAIDPGGTFTANHKKYPFYRLDDAIEFAMTYTAGEGIRIVKALPDDPAGAGASNGRS